MVLDHSNTSPNIISGGSSSRGHDFKERPLIELRMAMNLEPIYKITSTCGIFQGEDL